MEIGLWVEITKDGHPWKGAPALIFRIAEKKHWIENVYWAAVIAPGGWSPYLFRISDIEILSQPSEESIEKAKQIDGSIPK